MSNKNKFDSTFLTAVGATLAENDTLLAPIIEELVGHRVLNVNNAMSFDVHGSAEIYSLCHSVVTLDGVGETVVAIFWDATESGDFALTTREAHTTLIQAWNMQPVANSRGLYTIWFTDKKVNRDEDAICSLRPNMVANCSSGKVLNLPHSEIIYVDPARVSTEDDTCIGAFCAMLREEQLDSPYFQDLSAAVSSKLCTAVC